MARLWNYGWGKKLRLPGVDDLAAVNGVEVWLKIDEAPRYSVSSRGRVRNDETGKLLKINISGRGYLGLSLYPVYRGPAITRTIHILVARAFFGDMPGFEVNHIDGDKKNNFVGNLEWVTHAENMAHAKTSGLMRNVGVNRTPIRIIETGVIYESQSACAREIGGDARRINQCLTGNKRLRSHRGYTFEYV